MKWCMVAEESAMDNIDYRRKEGRTAWQKGGQS